MRLAQIARKVGMTPTDIQSFLESEFDIQLENEPNYKLNEEQLAAVYEKYPKIQPEIATATLNVEDDNTGKTVSEEDSLITDEFEPAVEESTEAEEIILEATNEEVVEESIEPETTQDKSPKKVTIHYQEENEVILEDEQEGNFEEAEYNPDAEFIEAPKVKLDGLKILGKIELPEKKAPVEEEKTAEEIEAEEADEIAHLEAAMRSQAQDVKVGKNSKDTDTSNSEEEEISEYKDAKGIYHFSHTQKENRARALVEIQLRDKAIKEKEKKKRHYEEMMKSRKAESQNKVEIKSSKPKKAVSQPKQKKQKAEPAKGFWAKFLRWLND